MTLKTAVMAAENSALHLKNKLHYKIYSYTVLKLYIYSFKTVYIQFLLYF